MRERHVAEAPLTVMGEGGRWRSLIPRQGGNGMQR